MHTLDGHSLLKYFKYPSRKKNLRIIKTQNTLLLTNLCFLSSVCCKLDSLCSVLSGKPFVVIGVDKETFGRFTGLGVPGPFTLDL